jgi:lipopolysaccharide export system ATP-binding protein
MNQNLRDPDVDVPEQLRELLERFARGDRSLVLALWALVDAADANGASTLSDVSRRYRDAHLANLRQEGRDASAEAGRLSLDEVRIYLVASALPRLQGNGAVVLPAGLLNDPTAPVLVAPALWTAISDQRAVASRVLRTSGTAHPIVRGTPATGRAQTQEGHAVLSASGLSKAYRGRRVVHDVALQVAQGEIVGLLGPNGAGKTTTFYMLVGLIAPLEGRIKFDGTDITDMPMYRRARLGIGYLSQEPSVFRKL